MVLLCISDIHGESKGLGEVLSAATDADVIVVAGDVTHLGGYAEAEKVLAPLVESGKPVVAVAGNMDGEGVQRFLQERGIDIHGRGIAIGPVGFHGLGGSNPSPFHTPFEIAADEARSLLERGHAEIADRDFRILISHAPPKDTKLDRSFTGMHVGSLEVLEFIRVREPHLCISGHIHESSGEDTVGRTLCLNIGPYKSGRYALVRIEGGTSTILWRKR